MIIEIDSKKLWYHGSNKKFNLLREGSTITQWKELAEAFSHKPTRLSETDGKIFHNGVEKGFLYIIDEPIEVDIDTYNHPMSSMYENAEFLTKRPLKVKLIKEL
ncbi:hypothetical protein KHQ81_07620 [Mycoplasmatota bacterium]|nr:hypothetical protein KHQ81_07620 [Mycoplasmatota bacterium]